jgi:ketosteroid isomerase-like protein
MSEHNRKVVLDFIESMSTNNPELADACLAPDACAVAKGFGKFAGVRNRDVMVGTIVAFNQILPTGLRLSPKRVIADGDNIAVECEGDAVTSEGKPYRNQYCFVFTLEGGKIKRVDEYFCNVLANEVLWPLVEATAGLEATPN